MAHSPLRLALLQVGAQTETELKEKKLRVEDALNATKVRPKAVPSTGLVCFLFCLLSSLQSLQSHVICSVCVRPLPLQWQPLIASPVAS